jgi:hypothetical protein
MRTWQCEKTSGIPAWFQFIFMGITQVLLFSMAYAQAKRQVVFQNLMAEPEHFEKSIFSPDRTEPAEHPPSQLIDASSDELSASSCVQTNPRVPLPPRSVALKTNFNNYLDTWPSPGATVSADEPPDEELIDEDLMEGS